MIGVMAPTAQRRVIGEFFNLFKTPWEFHRVGADYEVLICSDSHPADNSAPLVLIYGCNEGSFDSKMGVQLRPQSGMSILSFEGDRIPIYRNCSILSGPGRPILRTQDGESAGLEFASMDRVCVRLGFDLFAEVEYLLEQGQPLKHARIPTLDLQIALLRELIVAHSISLLEIPPVPGGYKFIVCLTHDLDHPGIRNHQWDHTIFGFLYRALFGSIVGFFRGQRSLRQVATNWKAAFSLPFVYLGYAKDFWKTIRRYREMEGDAPSTFFLIPQRNDPGRRANGPAPKRRAAQYGMDELGDDIKALFSEGCEVGLHGIDAWRDPVSARAELEAVRALGSGSEVGVRIHWLYFENDSPALLEKAGFSYDSTVGYNETIGFRAGTFQAFKPLDVDRLLELPMHIMDTALFFPAYLNLPAKEASVMINQMVDQAARFGGALTVNWHDRSIAPERLWDRPYIELLEYLKDKGAWFATCAEAVSWFRKRRSAVLEQAKGVPIKVTLASANDGQPALRVRLHHGRATKAGALPTDNRFSEVTLNDSKELDMAWLSPGGVVRVA
jgi:peptidoglycan/xylan/chitin deacetylase (PgdA/CDA1 family)